MADINVQMLDERENGYSFDVALAEGSQRQRHEVTLSRDDFMQYGSGSSSPDDFVRLVFQILLDRRSLDELDLQRVDVAELQTFYPELREELQRRT